MLDLIWNLFQDEDIERLRRDAAQRAAQDEQGRNQAGSVEARLLELEKRHEQLNTSIVCPFCGTRGASDNAFDTA